MQQSTTTPNTRPIPSFQFRFGSTTVISSLLTLWLVLALTACGNASAASASGATIATNHWQIAITSVNRQSALYWNNYGGKQDAIGEWLLVTITLTNIGKENFGINTWDFAIRDGAGNAYKHSNEWIALSQPERLGYASANNRQIPPGLTNSVLLVFDINPNATNLELIFNQDRHPHIPLPTQ